MRQVVTETEVRNHGNIFTSIIGVFFGIVEMILIIRLIMKMLAASTSASFVDFIYRISNFLVKPFEGIISNIVIKESNPNMIIEPPAIFAFIIIAFIGGLIMYLLTSLGTNHRDKTIESRNIL